MASTSAWFEAVPALLLALVVVIVPGLVLASAAGVRGALRWAIASPITFTVAGLSAIVLAAARVPYTAATFALVLVVTAVAAWLVRRWVVARRRATPVRTTDATPMRPTPARSASAGFAVAAAVALAASTIGFRLAAGIGSPTAVAQLFDNVFHLNAVGLIRATGNGSSLTMGNLTAASSGFYPAGFHDVVALTLGLGIEDVSVAMNAVSLVLAAVVWPMSCLYLASRLFGTRPDVLMVTAVASGLFAAFPYRLFSFGVLYPFMSGLAMLPVLIALLDEFFGDLRTPTRTRMSVIAALAAAAPGIALTHPSVLVAGLVFGLPFAVRSLVSTVRAGRAALTWVGSTGWATAYILGTIAVFVIVRPPLGTAPWDPVQDARGAVGSIFLVSPGTGLIGWALIPLAAVGAVRCIREARRFVVVGSLAGLGAVLYFASAALWHPGLRDLIAGVWYRDTERVSALFAIAALPLVVLGGVTLVRLLDRGARRLAPSAPRALTTAGAIVLIVAVMLVVGQRGALAQSQTWLGQSFGQEGVQALLSDDERQLLEELPDLVPPGDTVVGDPRTGASLTYAFSDRRALAPHIFGDRTSEEELLLNRWDEAGTDAQVCDAVRDLGAYWALDFGTDDVLGGGQTPMPGTDRASASPGVVEIARVGDAVLYEAIACR